MPDLRLPTDIPIHSMYGYAFLGEKTELERLKRLKERVSKPKGENVSVWDTPADDNEFLKEHFNQELANAFSVIGYHSAALLSMKLDEAKIDMLYENVKSVKTTLKTTRNQLEDYLKQYHEKAKTDSANKKLCRAKIAAIFALSNEQYETLEWLELEGAEHHKYNGCSTIEVKMTKQITKLQLNGQECCCTNVPVTSNMNFNLLCLTQFRSHAFSTILSLWFSSIAITFFFP